MTRVQSSKRGASASPAVENRKRTKRGLPPPENSVAAIMQHLLADGPSSPAGKNRKRIKRGVPPPENSVDIEEQLMTDVEKHGEAAEPLAQREEHDQVSHLGLTVPFSVTSFYLILHD